MVFSGNFGLDDSFQPFSSESVNPKNLQEGMTQSRDSILDDSRNRRKILSQTQLYSITSFLSNIKSINSKIKEPTAAIFS